MWDWATFSNRTLMQVNYISQFCILTAPSITSDGAKSKSLFRVTIQNKLS